MARLQRYRVLLTTRAEHDLSELETALEEAAGETGLRFVARVRTTIESLSRFPMRNPRADEAEAMRRNIRQYSVGWYRVVYEIGADAVVVLTVRHAARRSGFTF